MKAFIILIQFFLLLAFLFTNWSFIRSTDLKEIPYQIPENKFISIDGDSKDWKDKSFTGQLFSDKYGECPSKEDLEVNFKLAWNPQGLLVLLMMLILVE